MAKKYGKKAAKKVERVMRERKRGTLAQRALGKEGHEPQAGDRDRIVRGAPGRRQGAAQSEPQAKEEGETEREALA